MCVSFDVPCGARQVLSINMVRILGLRTWKWRGDIVMAAARDSTHELPCRCFVG